MGDDKFGGSKIPNAFSFGPILKDNDLRAMRGCCGLPAMVELKLYEGSEFRLSDLLDMFGGCHTTCLRLLNSEIYNKKN